MLHRFLKEGHLRVKHKGQHGKKLGVAVNTCKRSIWETEARGLLQVHGQPVLHSSGSAWTTEVLPLGQNYFL